MSEMRFGGSVSQQAMEAAIKELEGLVAGRISDEDFERVFGARWAKLAAMGIENDVLINAYGDKASGEEGRAVGNETQQARLVLERYDERRAGGRVKRRRKAVKPAGSSGKSAAGHTVGGEEVQPRRAEVESNGSAPMGQGGEERSPQGEVSPNGPDSEGEQL